MGGNDWVEHRKRGLCMYATSPGVYCDNQGTTILDLDGEPICEEHAASERKRDAERDVAIEARFARVGREFSELIYAKKSPLLWGPPGQGAIVVFPVGAVEHLLRDGA